MEKDKATELQQQTQQQQAQSHQSSNTGTCSDEFKDEFYNSGRIGRRNAMPDILDEDQRETTTADLPLKLSALTTNGECSKHFIYKYVTFHTKNSQLINLLFFINFVLHATLFFRSIVIIVDESSSS